MSGDWEAQCLRPGLSGSGWLAEVLIEEIDERAMAMRALRQCRLTRDGKGMCPASLKARECHSCTHHDCDVSQGKRKTTMIHETLQFSKLNKRPRANPCSDEKI